MQYQLVTLQKRYAAFLEILKKKLDFLPKNGRKTAIFARFLPLSNFEAP